MPFIDLFEVATYVLAPQKLPPLSPIVLAEIEKFYISERAHTRTPTTSSDEDSAADSQTDEDSVMDSPTDEDWSKKHL